MKACTLASVFTVAAAAYEKEWAEFQALNGARNGAIPEAFKENVDKVKQHNSKLGRSYTLSYTGPFADLSAEEFKASMNFGYKPGLRAASPWVAPNVSIADAVDWVAKGGVTPVKNQGQCGSCWAFSTTGSVEGAYFVASGELVSLSEEELVQCDDVDSGCQGGLMDSGFKFVEEQGLCKESDYPYTSGTGDRGSCKKGCSAAVEVTSFQDVPGGDEDALLQAVAQQPVSVAIEADKSAFQLYSGGVLDSDACGQQLDHGVLAVGFGSDGGKQYWKVKNSWGSSWGEGGYIRMVRGKNMCGIASQASYPTGAKAPSSIIV